MSYSILGLLYRLFSHLDDSDIDDILITLFELAGDYSSCIRIACDYITQTILDRLLILSSTSSPSPFIYSSTSSNFIKNKT
ncbi:unnamed protein product [Rotaria sp. Silwood2]|nr:unnamed protein product [Rotaria sp. Silwood2]